MIEVRNLCKAYNGKTVLDGLNLSFPIAKTSCIMGPSGGGKTTLLRIMLGLEKADDGEILGMEDKRPSFVFQEDRLCEHLSAAANIRLVCSKKVQNDDIKRALAAVGLPESSADQPVRSMSGGQKRRVAILRALMAEHDILFMDEPFKELDTETKERVIAHVREQSKGKTVVLVTHDEAECALMGGQCFVLG